MMDAASLASERTVFKTRGVLPWLASGTGHVALFAALIGFAVAYERNQRVDRRPTLSVVEFTAPPRPPRAARPPPAVPDPPIAAPRDLAPRTQIVHRAAASARTVAAPHVMAAQSSHANTTNAMVAGNSTDFHGGDVSGDPHPEPVRAPVETHPVERPELPQRPTPPLELADELLGVHPNIRCNASAVAALYPQAAVDNDTEADVPVEALVDRDGHITRAHARSDPGFGLAAAAERAVMTACHTTAIPRDNAGNAVATRVVHRIGFHLE